MTSSISDRDWTCGILGLWCLTGFKPVIFEPFARRIINWAISTVPPSLCRINLDQCTAGFFHQFQLNTSYHYILLMQRSSTIIVIPPHTHYFCSWVGSIPPSFVLPRSLYKPYSNLSLCVFHPFDCCVNFIIQIEGPSPPLPHSICLLQYCFLFFFCLWRCWK